jgi:hypothetical protein
VKVGWLSDHRRHADTRAYDLVNILLNPRGPRRPEVFSQPNVDAGSFLLNANANGGRYTERITRDIRRSRYHSWLVIGGRGSNVDTRTTQGEVVPARPATPTSCRLSHSRTI